jgi:hypothetical protein
LVHRDLETAPGRAGSVAAIDDLSSKHLAKYFGGDAAKLGVGCDYLGNRTTAASDKDVILRFFDAGEESRSFEGVQNMTDPLFRRQLFNAR